MKWYEKLFKKKEKIEKNQKLKLLIIDDQAEYLHSSLGISDDRAHEILKYCESAVELNNTIHNCLETVIEKCVHINEVPFATLTLYRLIEKNKRINYITL